jgi:outer membrane protein assembly factor BamA
MMRRTRYCSPGLAVLVLAAAASWLECAAQDTGRLGLMALPTFFYMPETGFGAGGMAMMTRSPPAGEDGIALTDSLRAGGSYTQNGQASGWASMEAYLGGSRARLGLDAAISRYPSRFFGLGPSASVDEAYVPLMGSAAASVGFRLSPVFYAGPRLRFSASKTLERESDGLLAKAGLVGSDGYVSKGLGFGLTFDTRDSSMTPTKGGYLDLGFMASPSLIGSSQDYSLACLDARTYLALLPSRKLVLALQARAEAAFGDPPFQELPRLGGDKLMRGYFDGRYRDACALALQAEIRLPIWWRLGITIFGGLAQVASSPSGFDLEHPKASGGIGFRVRLDDASKANMRVDVAWADGGPRWYFNFGEAF